MVRIWVQIEVLIGVPSVVLLSVQNADVASAEWTARVALPLLKVQARILPEPVFA